MTTDVGIPVSGGDIRVHFAYSLKRRGRPNGAKDKKPRKRRTKKEILEARHREEESWRNGN